MAPKSTGANETPDNPQQPPLTDQNFQTVLAAKDAKIGDLEKSNQLLQDEITGLKLKTSSLEEDAEFLKEKLELAHEVVENKDSVIRKLEETIENSKTVIAEFENGFLDKVAANASIQKDEVVAVKGDLERSFPRLAWESLPKDKSGWHNKVETPKEAQ